MTEFLSSQVGSEGQDIELVQNIGESLLQGMSNSLSASSLRATPDTGQTDEEVDEAENENRVKVRRKQVVISF